MTWIRARERTRLQGRRLICVSLCTQSGSRCPDLPKYGCRRTAVTHRITVRPERMAENLDIFDFQLTSDEMSQIATLDIGASLFFDHRDPAMVSWLNSRAE